MSRVTRLKKACAYSLQNQIELALENLQKAIQLSPEENRKIANTDSDFDNRVETKQRPTQILTTYEAIAICKTVLAIAIV